MSESLVVNEIYLSLQGESTFAGLPCIFIRLTACDLRCSYCDTAYAFTAGKKMPLNDALAKVRELAVPYQTATVPPVIANRLPLVELTGGEPLLQKNSLPLMATLCDEGFTVLIETSGAHDITAIDPRVRRIVDMKCPSSGEVARNRLANLPHLKATDEIKFVIGTAEDGEITPAATAAIAALRDHPVTAQTLEEAHRWAREAVEALEPLPTGPVKKALIRFADTIVERSS